MKTIQNNFHNIFLDNHNTHISIISIVQRIFSRKSYGDFSPHWIWLFSKENRKRLKPCISVVQLLPCVSSLPHVSNICSHCQRCFTNRVDHSIHECTYLTRPRTRLLQEIFSLGADIYIYVLVHANKHSQTNLLLGVECPEFLQILSDRAETFINICILNLHRMWCT